MTANRKPNPSHSTSVSIVPIRHKTYIDYILSQTYGIITYRGGRPSKYSTQ